MPSLTAGQSAEYDIPLNGRFEVTTTGEAYVDALSGPIVTGGESVRVLSDRPYARGPYSVACRVRVRCISGATSYGEAAVLTPVMATTGPGGVVRLAAGEHDPLAGNGLDVAPPGCGTVLLDWSTVTLGTPPSGWTVELDPTRTYAGRPALKVTATAEAGTSLIYTVSIPSTFFGGSTRLAFAVDPGDSAITGDTTKKVALWLRFADTTTHRIAMYVQPSHAVGEWFDSGALFRGDGESGQPNDHISGTAQWSKLQSEDVVSLQVVVTKSAGVAITRPVYFGPIVADPVRAETPVLSLFFDGPYSGVHKYARPIMQAYGIRSSMPLVLSRLLSSSSGIMTEAQVRQMYDLGHEVIYHSGAGAEGGWDSTTKYPDGSEYAILKAEIEEFWGWLRAHGMPRGISYGVVGFTNGLVNTQTYERRLNISNALRDAGFLAIRQLDGYRGSYYGTGGERQTVVTGSQLVTSAQTVGDVTTILDRLEARGGWTGLTFHDLILSGATGNTVNVSTFEAIALDIATRVRAGKLRVLPFSDAMRAIRASARPA